jgi:Holliday junction DNA helicase RuvA
MIAKITGTVQDILPSSVILDVGGVGYEVIITNSEKDIVVINETQTFYIAENIKEDEHTLYGFLDLDGRGMYYRLTSVSGVGPKAAMSIMAAHSTNEVAQAILQDNISLFSSVSGIGKKTAQRIILDLKGKLVDQEEAQAVDHEDPAYQALLSLGYKSKDAAAALKDVATDLSTQERVKLALKGKQK